MHPTDLERLAELIADRLAERLEQPRPLERLLTAAQVAERFGVARSWVYDRAEELGAVRLGAGPRGRLRFDATKVAAALASRDGSKRSQGAAVPAATDVPRRRRRRSTQTSVQPLPVRGRDR
jgi:predicted DNA-binding transcriptional regulator AlpA